MPDLTATAAKPLPPVPLTIADLIDTAEAMADALRQMIVRCNCGIAIPCRPCFDADRLLARYDGSVR